MQFFIVHGGLWDDPWFMELPKDGKLLWVYLITHPQSDNGFIPFAPRVWAAQTDLVPDDVKEIFTRFTSDGRCALENGMALVIKHISHRRLGGDSLKGAKKRIEALALKYPSLVSLCIASNPVLTGGEQTVDRGLSGGSTLSDTSGISNQLSVTGIKEPEYPPDASLTEREILAEMKEWRGIGEVDYQKWLKSIRKNAVDFPTVDLLDIARTVTLWLDKPGNRREKGSTARYRNFCKNASTPRAYGATGADSRPNGRPLTREEIEDMCGYE